MQRDLAALADSSFDLAVIGGGIIGASIARDAARRGLSIALVEKDDFASAASEAMSHLVHGGIRYLAQARIGMVRESLAERAIWRRIAPLHVRPQPCLLPLANKGFSGRWSMRAAVTLFNALGGSEGAPANAPCWLDAGQALAVEPTVAMPGLEGALRWHDYRVDEPERVVLSLVADSAAQGAVVANHAECVGLAIRSGRVEGIEMADGLGGGTLRITCKQVVNATGPWAASLASRLVSGQQAASLTPSKGIHIVAPALGGKHAINLAGKGQHGFVLPWRGMSLIGTTDDPFDGQPDGLVAGEDDVGMLACRIARMLPGGRAVLDHPIATYASARALPGTMSNTYTARRDDALADHAPDGAAGFLSVYGGKWTTARRVAETTVDRVVGAHHGPARACDTASASLGGTPSIAAETFREGWLSQLLAWPREEAESWIAAYGTGLPAILERFGEVKLTDPTVREEARFTLATESEMAVSSADIARRLSRWYGLANPGVEDRAATWLARRAKSIDAPGIGGGRT
ncbi:MAG: glycerol-3-phosphate dehydrogenase/oxidase [Rhizobiaceae bacterium]